MGAVGSLRMDVSKNCRHCRLLHSWTTFGYIWGLRVTPAKLANGRAFKHLAMSWLEVIWKSPKLKHLEASSVLHMPQANLVRACSYIDEGPFSPRPTGSYA